MKELFNFYYNEELINLIIKKAEEIRNQTLEETAYNSYLNIVKKTANLIKEMNVTEPFLISACFSYLLWNGYLTKDKKIMYNFYNRINNLNMLGADIILGNSVCLNNSAMLVNVLEQFNFESYNIQININKEINLNSKIDNKQNLIINNNEKKLTKVIGNHSITIFKIIDKYYISDPTNISFLYLTNSLKVKYAENSKKFKIKPLLTPFFNNIKSKKFYELFDNILNAKEEKIPLNFKDDIYKVGKIVCEQNRNLLEDFFIENKQDMDIICKKLKKQ